MELRYGRSILNVDFVQGFSYVGLEATMLNNVNRQFPRRKQSFPFFPMVKILLPAHGTNAIRAN